MNHIIFGMSDRDRLCRQQQHNFGASLTVKLNTIKSSVLSDNIMEMIPTERDFFVQW